jgi:hypothetical protein
VLRFHEWRRTQPSRRPSQSPLAQNNMRIWPNHKRACMIRINLRDLRGRSRWRPGSSMPKQ